jgi:hypothetical protein
MRRQIIAVAIAVLLSFTGRSAWGIFNVQENAGYFGTLNQHSLQYSYPSLGTGSNNMACGPSAATNSLIYLQNAFPSSYGNNLILSAGHDMDNDGSYTTYDNWIYTSGSGLASSSYMNTTLANGTWHDDFIWGLYKYVENKVPGMTSYSAEDYWSPTYWGNPPATYPPPSWVIGTTPTWDFLYNALNNSADVQVLFSYVNGGGHFVSITGMTWDNVQNSGTLNFMNPWDGQFESTNIRLSSGRMYTDYGGSNKSWIGEINALIPSTTDWKGGSSAATDWKVAANWNPNNSVPNGPGTKVSFGNQPAANNVVDMISQGQTVGKITFSANTSTTIQSTGVFALTLDNSGSVSTIDVAGTHTISAQVILNNDALIVGTGTLDLSGGITGSHDLEVDINLTATSIQVDTLTIGSGATVTIQDIPGGPLALSDNLKPVPEPSTLILLGIGAISLLTFAWRWRKRTA